MRKRICDKCSFEISYDGNPDTYNRAGSHPLPSEPGATIQSAMEVVEIDGKFLDLCVENGCLDQYKVQEATLVGDQEKKLKKWAEGE